MKKVSVIVPVFNVKEFLEKCIDSIINQSYQNLEIILVDDGSTDNSDLICDSYKEKDNRIKVIHKENGGLSSARNCGLEYATGEYVCFIDSDDYIENDMIEKLYKACIKNNSQISCCGKSIEKESKKILVNCNRDFCIESKEAIKKMLLLDEIDVSACDKLFSIELFKNIRFPIGQYYEDMGTTYKLFIQAEKISHIKDIGYHYVFREGSITNEQFKHNHLDMLTISKEMKKKIDQKYSDLNEVTESFYYLQLITILNKVYNSSNKNEYKNEYKKIKKEYDSQIFKILKNRYIPLYKKIMAIMIFFNMYKLINILKK